MQVRGINNSLNFKSKVILEYPSGGLTNKEKDEIDQFEEYSWRYKKLGEGKCASVYELFPNEFVIKKIEHKYDRFDNFESEADILRQIPSTFTNSQKLKARVLTEKGNYYLISSLKKGSPINFHNNPLSLSKIEGVLDSLFELDKALIYHQDLNNSNILLDGTNANIIDYQWSKKFHPASPYINERNALFFPEGVIPSNVEHYESTGFASYLNKYFASNGQSQTRNFLKDYLIKKSEYHHRRYRFFKDYLAQKGLISKDMENALKFERALYKVYENPTEDVLDIELMRMEFLRAHKKSYSFIDPNMEKSVNMFNSLPYVSNAILSVKNFSYNLDKLSGKYENDKYMRRYVRYNQKFADYWQGNFESWYPGTIDYLKRLAKKEPSEKQICDSWNDLKTYSFKSFSPIMRTEFTRKNPSYCSPSNLLPDSVDVANLKLHIYELLNINGLKKYNIIFQDGRSSVNFDFVVKSLDEMYKQFANCVSCNRAIDAFCVILTMRNLYAEIAKVDPCGASPIMELRRAVDNKKIIFDNIINTMGDKLLKTLSYDKPVYDTGWDFDLTRVYQYYPPKQTYSTASSKTEKKDFLDKLADWWNNL